MSMPLFENPKVALGFSGVVLAIAFVASIAFKELSPSDEAGASPIAGEETSGPPAAPQQAQAGFTPAANSGWTDDAGLSDDWGAAPATPRKAAGPSEAPEQTNNAPVVAEQSSRTVPTRDLGGSRVTTHVAPGVPEVRPPANIGSEQIRVSGG